MNTVAVFTIAAVFAVAGSSPPAPTTPNAQTGNRAAATLPNMATLSDVGLYQVGEKPWDLVYGFVDSDDQVIDITGWTATSTVVKPDGSTFTAPTVVSDGATGETTRPWTTAMTDQAGPYWSVITVTNGQYVHNSRDLCWFVEPSP